MKWTDSLAIAEILAHQYPRIDPTQIRFSELRKWVLALPQFDDDPAHCGERVLEAIQAAWIEEVA